MERDVLTPREVADRMGFSYHAILRAIRRGDLQAFEPIPGQYRIDVQEYERWRKTPPRRRATAKPTESWTSRARRNSAARGTGSYHRLRAIEAKAEFEQAIAAAERDGPAPDVHPRVHRAMLDAMRSELIELEEFIAHG